ncbi:MAG: DUF2231 domain-containing protein [Chitinophagaceae bacterium]|nr:MAG: DUF2231 domain-containing protein [Chitinophagaceae bacterium]
MKVFGHPVHPLLIHFPTALLPMDAVLTHLYCATGNESYYMAGAYCLWAGTALGLLAMVAGLIDALGIDRTDKPALLAALYHGFLNGLILLVYAVIAWRSAEAFPTPVLAGQQGAIVKSILVLALFVGNYLGGKLIYTHGIGINKKHPAHGNTRN